MANSSCDRKCGYRTFASFQKIGLNIAVLTKDPQVYSEKGQIANILGFETYAREHPLTFAVVVQVVAQAICE